jgi:hypothetical protein
MRRARTAIVLVFGLLLGPAHADQIDDARAAIIRKLKDPESARFTDVRVNGEVVCGMVNAKNAYGGYPGAHKFYYGIDIKRGFIEGGSDISTDPLDALANGYSKFCN